MAVQNQGNRNKVKEMMDFMIQKQRENAMGEWDIPKTEESAEINPTNRFYKTPDTKANMPDPRKPNGNGDIDIRLARVLQAQKGKM